MLAALPTAAPLQLQILGVLGVGLVGLTISAVLVGLVLGAVPHRLANAGALPDAAALRLGVAVGLFGAAAAPPPRCSDRPHGSARPTSPPPAPSSRSSRARSIRSRAC